MAKGRHTDVPGTPGTIGAIPKSVPARGNFRHGPGGSQVRNLKGQFAGGFSVNWEGLTLVAQLPYMMQAELRNRRDAALADLQAEMVAYAQQNAPWQDVSGDARAELNSPAIVRESNGDATVILAHGVGYGVYLETRDGGALGIIVPTIEKFAAELGARMQNVKP